jgi:type 2 lantibiotic biosynthesis protein LanM
LDAAAGIGRRLRELASERGDDVVWSSVEPLGTQSWQMVDVGDDLYAGRSGIALFLAHLANETGDLELERLARRIAQTLGVSDGHRPSASIGAYSGTSGVVYALTHLGALWNDTALLRRAATLVDDLVPSIDTDGRHDILGGKAGCILALLACETVLEPSAILQAAIAAGDHLVRSAERQARGVAWTIAGQDQPLTGFAHGAAGIGCALAALWRRTRREPYRTYAIDAFEYERHVFSERHQNWPDFRKDRTVPEGGGHGYGAFWCYGAAGIGLSRVLAARCLDADDLSRETRIAARTVLAHGECWNHSLCHGEFGNAEILKLCASALADPDLLYQADRRERAAVASVLANGPVCGVDRDVDFESPGLMCGIAGVGYGLLRIARPGSLPSLLCLDAPGHVD